MVVDPGKQAFELQLLVIWGDTTSFGTGAQATIAIYTQANCYVSSTLAVGESAFFGYVTERYESMRGSVNKNGWYARQGIGSIEQAIKLPLFATSASETQSAPRNSAPGYEI